MGVRCSNIGRAMCNCIDVIIQILAAMYRLMGGNVKCNGIIVQRGGAIFKMWRYNCSNDAV